MPRLTSLAPATFPQPCWTDDDGCPICWDDIEITVREEPCFQLAGNVSPSAHPSLPTSFAATSDPNGGCLPNDEGVTHQPVGSTVEARVVEKYLDRFEAILVSNMTALTEAVKSIRLDNSSTIPTEKRKTVVSTLPGRTRTNLSLHESRSPSQSLSRVFSSFIPIPTRRCHGSAQGSFGSIRLKKAISSAMANDILSHIPTTKSIKLQTAPDGRFASLGDRIQESLCLRMLVITCLIVSTVTFWMQVDQLASDGTTSTSLELVETICAVIFTLVLLPRGISVLRCDHLKGTRVDYDFVLEAITVFFAWFDFVVSNLSKANVNSRELSSVLSFARSVRSLRLCRLIFFLPQVRFVVLTILNSLDMLFWSALLIIVVTFVFAVTITEGAAHVIRSNEFMDDLADDTTEDFGSVIRSMYTLFRCCVGGMDWGEPAAYILKMGWSYFIAFLIYISLMTFSILNVVSGFFVDGAIVLRERDREMCIERVTEKNKHIAHDLMALLLDIDTDGDDSITLAEWVEALQNRRVRVLLDSMGFDSSEGRRAFDTIDVDANGIISLQELVSGMQRLKGKVTGLHMDMLLRRTACFGEMHKILNDIAAKLK
eukprot:TRINITY_DN18495_c0_g2_i1.p1 TRINITY_DN18495_c0_g2~~TRINITY_DN18495_c0_g2_i1.p1  ORF type:complete len:647 (-),score=79.24 TRINITY_DN18495_c0_g2_i1:174-1970(-)